MQRYLRLSEAKQALDRGQQIEQFLGPFRFENDMAIRYTTIHREKNKVVATIFEVLQPAQESLFEVTTFLPARNRPADEFHFDTLEEACSFLEYRNGASWGKFVHQGMINEEYKDYRSGKASASSF
jgi:hypothetical protein